MFTCFFTKDIPNNSQSDNAKKKRNLCSDHDIIKIHKLPSIYSSVFTAIYEDRIAASKFTVNTNGWLEANAAINQTTTKFEQIAEKIFNWAFEKVIIDKIILT